MSQNLRKKFFALFVSFKELPSILKMRDTHSNKNRSIIIKSKGFRDSPPTKRANVTMSGSHAVSLRGLDITVDPCWGSVGLDNFLFGEPLLEQMECKLTIYVHHLLRRCRSHLSLDELCLSCPGH